eukprot:gene19693-23558_t
MSGESSTEEEELQNLQGLLKKHVSFQAPLREDHPLNNDLEVLEHSALRRQLNSAQAKIKDYEQEIADLKRSLAISERSNVHARNYMIRRQRVAIERMMRLSLYLMFTEWAKVSVADKLSTEEHPAATEGSSPWQQRFTMVYGANSIFIDKGLSNTLKGISRKTASAIMIDGALEDRNEETEDEEEEEEEEEMDVDSETEEQETNGAWRQARISAKSIMMSQLDVEARRSMVWEDQDSVAGTPHATCLDSDAGAPRFDGAEFFSCAQTEESAAQTDLYMTHIAEMEHRCQDLEKPAPDQASEHQGANTKGKRRTKPKVSFAQDDLEQSHMNEELKAQSPPGQDLLGEVLTTRSSPKQVQLKEVKLRTASRDDELPSRGDGKRYRDVGRETELKLVEESRAGRLRGEEAPFLNTPMMKLKQPWRALNILMGHEVPEPPEETFEEEDMDYGMTPTTTVAYKQHTPFSSTAAFSEDSVQDHASHSGTRSVSMYGSFP